MKAWLSYTCGNTRIQGRATVTPAPPQEVQTPAQERSARLSQAACVIQTIGLGRVSEDQELPTARRNKRVIQRGRGRKRGRPRKHVRVPTVNLDGASSSESEGEQQRNKIQCQKPERTLADRREDLHITLSPDKMCRGIMSDSSDSEEDQKSPLTFSPSPNPVVHQPINGINSLPSDTSDDDIFGVDYSACNLQALKSAFKEIKSTEAATTPPPLGHLSSSSSANPVHHVDNDDVCVIECPVNTHSRWNTGARRDSRSPSPLLFAIDGPVQSENSSTSSKKRMKEDNNSLAKTRSQLDKSARREIMSLSDSLNLSNDVILSDGEDEEDPNPVIHVRIKWGSENFREPIRKWQKFVHLYEVLGRKYAVSPDNVVLNLRDKIISPAHCPGDLKVTIADCIEGGIHLQSNSVNKKMAGAETRVLEASKDPNVILLRVQSSEKKAVTMVSLGITEKMSILMHKYAEEKQINLKQLQFMFDGEILSPRSTPKSLDMEGGECIDVYKIA